jgi:hypothetical protein
MSTNDLGTEGADAGWRKANVVYSRVRTEIASMCESFSITATKIEDVDLENAAAAWALRGREMRLLPPLMGAILLPKFCGLNLRSSTP